MTSTEETKAAGDQGMTWRVLEFYSDIGGMRYSLVQAAVNAVVVEAFDINDKANDVYEHNFHHRPFQGNIQSLTVADLDSHGANAWLLSPPCQPYTRQGLQKQSGDARAFSFLRILELIPDAKSPPDVLFVENVVGFETSDTHEKMVGILGNSGYVTQEFILSPLQFGVPYSRPRYFCLAKRKPRAFKHHILNNRLLYSPCPLVNTDEISSSNKWDEPQDDWDKVSLSCELIDKFLESKCFDTLSVENEFADCFVVTGNQCGPITNMMEQYFVPLSLIERWGSAMDVVYPDSKRCCCFTKSYYRYLKGTGSLLATLQPKHKGKLSPLKEQGLRYFTPKEVANLHSFPQEFSFPEHITLKQRYALLGNSLSVAVVAPLLCYLFSQPT